MVNIEETNINFLVTYYNALINMQERHKCVSIAPEYYKQRANKIDASLDDMEKRILERMYEPDRTY